LLNKSNLFSFGIYASSNLINALIPFLLLPFLTRYISPNDYGIYSLYIVLVNVIVPFSGLNISRSIMRNYVDRGEISLPIYIFNCFLISTLITVVILSVLFIFSDTISILLGFPEYLLWIPIIASYGQTYLATSLGLLQMNNKPIFFGLSRIGQSLVLGLLTVYLVGNLDLNFKGAIFGHAISMILVIPVTVFFLKKYKYIIAKIRFNDIKQSVKYGAPLIPHVVGMVLIIMADRFFIAHFMSMHEVGIYSAGYQVSLVLFLLITSFNQSWVPWFYAKLKLEDKKINIKIVKITYVYYGLLIVLGILLSIASEPFINVYLDSSFQEAAEVVKWLIYGSVLHGMYIMVSNYLYFSKDTYLLSIAAVVVSILNASLNWVLIPINGIVGAAQASIISFFCVFLLTWFFSTKKIKMPWFFIRHETHD
jgi:O-antigen/teichoic acid export membrane protein